MVLLLDNYDSFTFNIYQYLSMLGEKVQVVRNDKTTVDKIKSKNYKFICLSPGPGEPKKAGITLDVIEQLHNKVPILGVCLGHQSIGESFGGKIVRAKKLMHGKVSVIEHHSVGIFKGLPKKLEVTRYHSLVIDPSSLPSCLEVTATTEDGVIMGVRHKVYKVEGVQFHPESIQTKFGMAMFKNFIKGIN